MCACVDEYVYISYHNCISLKYNFTLEVLPVRLLVTLHGSENQILHIATSWQVAIGEQG